MPHSLPPWTRSVHHDGSGRYVTAAHSSSAGAGKAFDIRIRHAFGAPIRRAFLRFAPDGEQRFLEMKRQPDGAGSSWWSSLLPAVMPRLSYRFLLLTDDEAWWYTARGIGQSTPTDDGDFRIVSGSEGPGWLADTVFYQIAPDRFHNGDPSISVRTGEYTYHGKSTVQRAWGEDPALAWDQAHVEFFGGDLKGSRRRFRICSTSA